VSTSTPFPAPEPAPLGARTQTLLQRALRAENVAVYGYGVVGAHLRGQARVTALGDLDAHRARRDRVRLLLADRGLSPAPAAPAYALPTPVTDAASATALAVRLEEGVAAHYADLVAVALGSRQEFAAAALVDAAVRGARWRGKPVPFPGLPERSG